MKLDKRDIIKSEEYVCWKDKWFNFFTHPAVIFAEFVLFFVCFYKDIA